MLVAWDRVRHNKGARSAGVDGRSAYAVEAEIGVEVFCDRLRQRLKTRTFRPVPVRERMIPKANGKKRRLGIATVSDRVVQACLKLVLEPIFEADFLPCSYGFRPKRRTHDAVDASSAKNGWGCKFTTSGNWPTSTSLDGRNGRRGYA